MSEVRLVLERDGLEPLVLSEDLVMFSMDLDTEVREFTVGEFVDLQRRILAYARRTTPEQ